jgi:hypothetical protein
LEFVLRSRLFRAPYNASVQNAHPDSQRPWASGFSPKHVARQLHYPEQVSANLKRKKSLKNSRQSDWWAETPASRRAGITKILSASPATSLALTLLFLAGEIAPEAAMQPPYEDMTAIEETQIIFSPPGGHGMQGAGP